MIFSLFFEGFLDKTLQQIRSKRPYFLFFDPEAERLMEKGDQKQIQQLLATEGEPSGPESSPSESSDDDPGSDPTPGPPKPIEGSEQGGDPGDSSGEDQGSNPGGDQGGGREGNTPPPNPASPPHFPSGDESQPDEVMAAQATHLSHHQAMQDRLNVVEDVAQDHLDGTILISATSADVYVKELERMHPKLEELAIGCYTHFQDDASVPLDQNPRYSAINTQIKLKLDHHRILTKMMDISKSLSTSVTGTRLKTPKIAVPKFSGLHRDWPTFKSEFNLLVRNNPTYSSTERMRLLIEALSEGEAKENIPDLTVTDGNWDIAWKRIEGRYDSSRETVHAAIRPLLELPPLMSQSESGLHKLISTIRTTKAQLKQVNLGGVSEADVLYLHFIMTRLDTKTIKEFNQTLTTNDVPSLQTCIVLLEMQGKNVGLTKEIKSNSAAAAPSRNKTGRDHKGAKALVRIIQDPSLHSGYHHLGIATSGDISTFDHLKNIELADMFYNKPAKIDILLGVTVVARIMRDKARIGHRGSSNAYYTDLGWIVMGSVVATGPKSVMAIYGSNPPL
ncbi:unnamed protein product [Allacma fusca]|uniref:Uncharacterized protein n=1 Tax=Allacma fusca TaxID=39272 RepID=A0A8J2JKM4_9HEXA|nr:unnamed protein product [Allacma fusca]